MSSPGEEGDPNSRLLILAEAPAKTEMKLGRPLCGPSGEVLDHCLHAAGIARRQCYILNIWPFEVRKDLRMSIFDGPDLLWYRDKGVTAAGYAAAEKTFQKIVDCKANAILTLGSSALDYCMGGSHAMLKWRGSPLWSERFGKKLIPTIHPAATIHGVYIWRHLIITDMVKVKLELDSPELRLTSRNLMIEPTYAEFYHYINKCREAGRVCTDIEVMNHQVSCFSLSCDHREALTVPLVGRDGKPYWSEEDETQIWLEYAKLMSDTSIMKINHNLVGFDMVFLLAQNNIHTRGKLGDTMIAQSIMYPDFKMGLDFTASFHLREPYWKDDGKIWKKMDITWEVFQRYCGRDAACTLELWDILEKEMTERGYWDTYNMTVRMAEPLAYMAVRGLKVDKEGLAATKIRLEDAIERKEAELEDVALYSFSVSSPKQCKEYFYGELGLPPYLNKDGGVSTDDKAMSRIARKGGKGAREARLVQELRALKKLKGTYIEVELDKDDRLRCSWNPRGTWPGRLSSSKTIFGTGMNLQNLHPEFKGFIVAG